MMIHSLPEQHIQYALVPLLFIGLMAGSAVAAKDQQRKAQHAAEDKVSKAAEQQRKLLELQAGEYDVIEKQAMKIQALTSQTDSLANILAQQGTKQPTIFTLPGNESTNPIDRINSAIDDFIKGWI